jgi:hypothetical protein
MNKKEMTLLCVIFFCLHLTMIAQTRRAFLVGINNYKPGEPVEKQLCRKVEKVKNLYGCINDVEAIKGILISRFYFKPENIHVLKNEEATRNNILSGIETNLIEEAAPNDVCVFYFAGHGSRVKNSKSNEPDKKDETLVPADWYRGVGDIRDKELKKLFNRILDKKANLTVIIDACHSGSISRGIPVKVDYRFMPENECDVAESPDKAKEPAERGALILSASRDFQMAAEIEDENGDCYGLFTWALLKILRSIHFDEPIENILLRVNALMQSEGIKLEINLNAPTLEALSELRKKPLFGAKPGKDSGAVAAVVKVRGKRITFQAGLAAGIRKNCELKNITVKQDKPVVRVQVTEVYGLNFCLAEVISGDAGKISVGDFFEIDRWVAPREARMRVWIPGSNLSGEMLLRISRQIAGLKNSNHIQWVEDPTETNPTHIMSWYQSSWRIVTRDGKVMELGKQPRAAAIIEKIMKSRPVGSKKPRLFLRLPLSSRMQKIIASEIKHYSDSIKILTSSQGAHYILVGRLSGESIEYAWMLPNMSRQEANKTKVFAGGVRKAQSAMRHAPSPWPPEAITMPIRSLWITAGKENRKAAVELRDTLLGLVKIRAWLQLSSPPDKGDFPYRLALKHAKTGEVKTSGPLLEGEEYKLVLRAYKEKPGIKINERYVYVFSINSSGEGTLLFPPRHRRNSENYFPAVDEFKREIHLSDKALFTIGDPFGMDTYFLLTSEEPITNPEVLDFKGVRGKPPPGKNYTPLEKLLYGLGSSYRGRPPTTHINWSIQRLPILSIPRRDLKTSGGQGDSFRENRPVKHLDPPQKLLINSCFFPLLYFPLL